MAIRFEDKAPEAKPGRKEAIGKNDVAEEPAPAPSDPAPQQAGAAKKKAVRSRNGPAQPA